MAETKMDTTVVNTFLERWHRMVADRDADAIGDLLAEDVIIGAPPYWEPLEGHPLVTHLLGIIVTTIEDLRYRREWIDGNELALEFRGQVGDEQLQGIDLITLDDDGRVRRIDVMIRPLNALTALFERVAPQMAAYLESL